MTNLTLRRTAVFNNIMMISNPTGADWMQAMRATGNSAGTGPVANNALGQHANMPLMLNALDVVIRMRTGKFSVRRTMTGFTLDSTVTGGKPVQ